MSTTPKETDIIPSSLSRLLAEAKEIHESNLIQLKIAKQSQERWKKRTINSFNEKSTSCIQDRSGKEKQHPRIEVRILRDYFSDIHLLDVVDKVKSVRWTEPIRSCSSTVI